MTSKLIAVRNFTVFPYKYLTIRG